jgi:hypothetical protein
MSRLVRLTLMWLLALALPLQGVSAATMLACGSGHHRPAASQVTAHSHGHMQSRHVHAGDASAHEHGAVAQPDIGATDPAQSVAHKCSACASCCLSAVAPPAAVCFQPITLPDVFAPLVVTTLAAHLTEGLERPPRRFLA